MQARAAAGAADSSAAAGASRPSCRLGRGGWAPGVPEQWARVDKRVCKAATGTPEVGQGSLQPIPCPFLSPQLGVLPDTREDAVARLERLFAQVPAQCSLLGFSCIFILFGRGRAHRWPARSACMCRCGRAQRGSGGAGAGGPARCRQAGGPLVWQMWAVVASTCSGCHCPASLSCQAGLIYLLGPHPALPPCKKLDLCFHPLLTFCFHVLTPAPPVGGRG